MKFREQRVPLVGIPHDPRQVATPGPVPQGAAARPRMCP